MRALYLMGLAAMAFAVQPAAAEDDPKFQASAHIYDTYCTQCHGVQRNGKGVNTAGMSVQPRDHSDAAGMASIPNAEMIEVIHKGGAAANKSALMPPWASVLTDEQITDMVAYLRHVCKCGG
ncbi:MAG TPA: cytochrome c [Sphingomonadaceae bacterium]|nr:cytochrome c [Sphingomonadaceae bacterium]